MQWFTWATCSQNAASSSQLFSPSHRSKQMWEVVGMGTYLNLTKGWEKPNSLSVLSPRTPVSQTDSWYTDHFLHSDCFCWSYCPQLDPFSTSEMLTPELYCVLSETGSDCCRKQQGRARQTRMLRWYWGLECRNLCHVWSRNVNKKVIAGEITIASKVIMMQIRNKKNITASLVIFISYPSLCYTRVSHKELFLRLLSKLLTRESLQNNCNFLQWLFFFFFVPLCVASSLATDSSKSFLLPTGFFSAWWLFLLPLSSKPQALNGPCWNSFSWMDYTCSLNGQRTLVFKALKTASPFWPQGSVGRSASWHCQTTSSAAWAHLAWRLSFSIVN